MTASDNPQKALPDDAQSLSPWKKLPARAVAGLFQVGYAPGRDLLLVLSAQGRGIFDCMTGERLARDDEEPMDFFDPICLVADGFGILQDQHVHMAGLFGGGLPATTSDHYRLEEQSPAWPKHEIYLIKPDRSRSLAGDDGACEMRAFGFSQTGFSFVIATSCELVMFNR